jgi:hypothetical protein
MPSKPDMHSVWQNLIRAFGGLLEEGLETAFLPWLGKTDFLTDTWGLLSELGRTTSIRESETLTG